MDFSLSDEQKLLTDSVQRFVRQQYERQWRMACDPLREQESKEILKATNAARAFQIGEKMKSLEMDEVENRAFDDLWERDHA